MKLSRIAVLLVVVVACQPPEPVAPPALPPPPVQPPPVAAPQPAAPVLDKEFLRLFSESRHFTRGAPQGVAVTPDGRSALFLRSHPRDPKQSLFEMDIATGVVREVLSPDALDKVPEHLTAEERARRERMRITAKGFTSFELSRDGHTLVTGLSGKLYALDRASGHGGFLDIGKGAAIDPHLSPDGRLLAYVQDDDVWVVPVDGKGRPRAITRGGNGERTHGLAEFAASEELARERGFWWSPDSKAILYEESDTSGVQHFTIADPGHPERPVDRFPFPRAGSANANVRFGMTRLASPGITAWIEWDRAAMPYVARVTWTEKAPPTLLVLDRLQKNAVALVVDPASGKTREAAREHDDAWVTVVTPGGTTGVPRWLKDGSGFLWFGERDGDARYGLVSARDPSSVRWITPAHVQATEILDVDDARGVAIMETTRDGLHYEVTRVPLAGGEATAVARLDDGAVYASFDEAHDVFVAFERSLSRPPRTVVRSTDGKIAREIPSLLEFPPLPAAEIVDVGPDKIHVALVRPRGYVPGARYPLIDAAYAGPVAQMVELDARSMLLRQWMADATGAIVVAIDAKGTPGRGREWERAILGKLGEVPLAGHVEAIRALAAGHPEIDPSRVGVYGWSFGGYFASLAILARPDVYSAAVAIAPGCTDWRDYDTAYTERYLGLPDESAAAYDAASLLPFARKPPGPGKQPAFLVAHGTADDNVYFLNSLRLLEALALAGRPVRFLPFIGETHQIATPEDEAAVWTQAAETLRDALSLPR